jgi:DNA-binding NtrC family response regulator/pSer/pThr/pTyr-binding forkhead associated (FHA) protein
MDPSMKAPAETTRLEPGVPEVGRPARVVLVVYHRDGAESVALRAGVPVVVGRLPPADVAIPDASLSRVHARFTLTASGVVVEDLGSTNGTLVGGERVERQALESDEEVQLGAVIAAVHSVGKAGEGAGPALRGHDAFVAALDAELVRARHFGRAATLVMLRPRERGDGVRAFWPELRALLAPVDVAGLYGGDVLELLLVEVGARAAEERVASQLRGVPAALVCGIASFPDAGASAQELVELARAALERSGGPSIRVARADVAHTVAAGAAPEEPVFASAAMRSVVQLARRLGRAVLPVLIEGETGTGKEVLARLVHEAGPRRERPLVCVNCGGIPKDLVESTLFGHERGAFTGAAQQRKGVFEAALGGTVLLDEVGELPAAAQASLLRVLETRRITRVGATDEIELDVRVVAATHRDLESMVEAGLFREDLLFRLNGMTLAIPPLRDRREDIPALSAAFLRQANEANECHVAAISDDAMRLLESYAWPGNVRELKNAIARAVVIADGDQVTPLELPERVRRAGGAVVAPDATGSMAADATAAIAPEPLAAEGNLRSRVERYEAAVLGEALGACAWNLPEAARRLEMPLRTLQHKVALHGLRKR